MSEEDFLDGPRCATAGCDRRAGVRLHIPWDEDREVCPAHGRALGQEPGVVAIPLDDADDAWP